MIEGWLWHALMAPPTIRWFSVTVCAAFFTVGFWLVSGQQYWRTHRKLEVGQKQAMAAYESQLKMFAKMLARMMCKQRMQQQNQRTDDRVPC